jgi:large subunit ribosomal protein L1
MPKNGKKYTAAVAKLEVDKKYTLDEGLQLLPEVSYSKFKGTAQISFRLGVDPAKADQMIRGAVVLPHGLGKTIRVVVFAKGDKEKEALDAGADFVGGDDLVEKIRGGWLDFDTAIATPDMMGSVGKIGKVLGPRGLMPNPKTGTVTFDVAKAVTESKAGKVEYRVDKTGNLHVPIGKVAFDAQKLKENAMSVVDAVLRAKPSSAKGVYMRGVTLSSTMSPGIPLEPNDVANQTRKGV